MLPLAHRMCHSRDFDTAVRRGRRAGRCTLVVHAAIQLSESESGEVLTSASPAKVGLVVSRGVGSAVVRNRVKRRLRAAMRSRLGQLPPGALVVLRANPAAANATAFDLIADLDVALSRILQRLSSRGGGS